MGIGFVLIFWIILLGIVGLPVAAFFAYWSWRNGNLTGAPAKARAAMAGLLPFALIPVGLIWFFAYAVFCGTVRHVDPGLGDSWYVPLRHGYYFCMIDTTDEGFLMKNECSGEPPVSAIRELAQVGDSIVGWSGTKGAFSLDMAAGELKQLANKDIALTQYSPPLSLQTARAFYRSRRYGWQDVAALIVLLGLVVPIMWIWFNRFIRSKTTRV
jgi:hypothetical protein